MAHRKTLASLAAELGVSRTTVSNAYNHPEQLSEGLRRKILAAAAAHGYPGPDPTARKLRLQRAEALGVVLTEHLTYAFEDLASVDFLAGLAAASSAMSSSLLLIPGGPSGRDKVSSLQAAAVDGFVVYSVAAGDPYLLAAQRRQLPVVICDQPKDTGAAFVGIDDKAAIMPAATAVVAAGHRRIGVLTIRLRTDIDGPVAYEDIASADLHVQRDRVLGALDSCAAAGIDPSTVPVVSTFINDAAANARAARCLLDSYPDLTAVICTTDSLALALLEVASARGLSVPEDLSITGFDGIAPARSRGISTVIQPNKAKGAAAGKLLYELIAQDNAGGQGTSGGQAASEGQGTAPGRQKILETSFAPGGTIAPPRAG